MKKNRQRTSVTPHRIMELSSIWMMPQHKRDWNKKDDGEDFYGFEGGVLIKRDDGKEVHISVRSTVELRAEHGRMFHFANSCAMKNDKHEASVHVNDILTEMGLTLRADNRKRIETLLKGCISATVIIKSASGSEMFHLLESVKYEHMTGLISFRINKDYYDAVKKNRERYINIDGVMSLRASNSLAIELATYLQIRGGGVDKETGSPKPAKTVSHGDLVLYLHMVYSTKEEDHKTRENLLRSAFKSLEKKGYPKYKLMTIEGHKVWSCNPSTKTAKTFSQIDDFSE